MNVLILGAAGFIGKNLIRELLETTEDSLILYDVRECDYESFISSKYRGRYQAICDNFTECSDFSAITEGVAVVYHLISTTLPNTPMELVTKGITDNVVVTSRLLDACVKNGVKKIVFLSSGGTVYGIGNTPPFAEESMTNPISAYGLQKLSIEKMLYLYNYTFGMDYSIIRLSNPFGPYQRPNGVQGVVTTFVYNALHDMPIHVYGDGKVVRDYIYIDDAIRAIKNISGYVGEYKLFNVGSGVGTSIQGVIQVIEDVMNKKLEVHYEKGRKADVPVNILDISRYESHFGRLIYDTLESGIRKTITFFQENR